MKLKFRRIFFGNWLPYADDIKPLRDRAMREAVHQGLSNAMQHNFLAASAASLLACAVTTAGILVVRQYKEWTQRNAVYFICFAAGVLVSVSFLHIVPTAFAMNIEAPRYLLAGYLAMLGFDRFLTAYVCDKPINSDYALGLLPLLGIGFHSYLDGVIYAISFSVGTFTGALVALGMVLHEFPEGVVTYALLLRSGFSERMSFLLAFAAAAITTPLGTLTSFAFISHISEPVLGLLLSLSAGTLVYVGATHLLPRAEREPRRFSVIALIVGVLVAIGIILAKQ